MLDMGRCRCLFTTTATARRITAFKKALKRFKHFVFELTHQFKLNKIIKGSGVCD